MEGFGKKIDKKRRQYFVEDVCDSVHVTQPTKHCVDGREDKTDDNAHCHAAYKEHRKRSRRIYQGKRSRNGCCNRELKRDNARCVVNQRLSGEKHLLAMSQVDVGLECGNRGCISWS